MINVSFGMKCPHGHMSAQVSVGGAGPATCNVCGEALVPNVGAAPVGVNRGCRHCGTHIGMLSHDSGKCPTCGHPWG